MDINYFTQVIVPFEIIIMVSNYTFICKFKEERKSNIKGFNHKCQWGSASDKINTGRGKKY